MFTVHAIFFRAFCVIMNLPLLTFIVVLPTGMVSFKLVCACAVVLMLVLWIATFVVLIVFTVVFMAATSFVVHLCRFVVRCVIAFIVHLMHYFFVKIVLSMARMAFITPMLLMLLLLLTILLPHVVVSHSVVGVVNS